MCVNVRGFLIQANNGIQWKEGRKEGWQGGILVARKRNAGLLRELGRKKEKEGWLEEIQECKDEGRITYSMEAGRRYG